MSEIEEGGEQRDADTRLERTRVEPDNHERKRRRYGVGMSRRLLYAPHAAERGHEEQEHQASEHALEGRIGHVANENGTDHRPERNRKEHRQDIAHA